jgi:acetyl esterase/lipase
MDRRAVIGLGTSALVGLALDNSSAGTTAQGDADSVLPLWSGTPPGGDGVHLKLDSVDRSFWPGAPHDRAVDHIGQPTLSLYRPDRPDGSALLIVPGGGYRHLLIDKEGSEVARRFNGAGITGFVLAHRLPAEGWANRADVPLQDAQRAMRLIRFRAKEIGIAPVRVGVLGFSAGGHVAASLITRFDSPTYQPRDDADRLSARPDFAGLIYPVISMLSPIAHTASREELLGREPTTAQEAAASCERLVTPRSSPAFILAAADDDQVDPRNSLAMLSALREAHVESELHLFQEGGHGFALRRIAGKPLAAWPDLFLRWGASQGVFKGIAP